MPVVSAVVCFALACTPQKVIVIDGDTIVVQGERIRLLGINAPELKGKCREESIRALRARSRLMDLMKSAKIDIKRDGFDRYRRTLASVSVGGD
jgi:micrococcal nuclease